MENPSPCQKGTVGWLWSNLYCHPQVFWVRFNPLNLILTCVLVKSSEKSLNHLESNFHALAAPRDPRAFTRTVPLWLRSFTRSWESVLPVSVSLDCGRLDRYYLVSLHSQYSHRYKSIVFYNATFQVHPHRDFSGVCNFPVGCCKFSSPSGWDQPDFCLASALKRWLKQTMDPRKKWYTHVHSNPNVWKIRLHTCFESHGPSLNFMCGPKTI